MTDATTTEFFKEQAEGRDGFRMQLHTRTEHPGAIFLHQGAGGFSFCKLIEPAEARRIAEALQAAANQAEADAAFFARVSA